MTVSPGDPASQELTRRLGTRDAVLIGLGAMLGAGVFAGFAPAARAAGSALLIALALAAVVAWCNATSSARLAARYPASGGSYVYGRERLGPFWGFLAGWGFCVGKTASCAAMALTVASYLVPGAGRAVRTVLAVAAVAALTAVNYRGVHRSAAVTRGLVAMVLVVLGAAVAGAFLGGRTSVDHLGPFPDHAAAGVLQAAGLLFFAFAGYARVATLGEEVREPARTIPRAISIALGCTLVIYTAVAFALLFTLGPAGVAASTDPLAEAVATGSWSWLEPVVRVGAAVAALSSLLALVLGVSRTVLAMARDGQLPRRLAAVHQRFGVPHRAEIAVGSLVVIVVCVVDLRQAIGFSSFAVLAYYAITNASAWTLRGEERPLRLVSIAGLAGCLLLAFSLPVTSVVAGSAVLVGGAAWYGIRRRWPNSRG